MLECYLHDSSRDKFASIFENVVLGSFKSFFQLDHQTIISLLSKCYEKWLVFSSWVIMIVAQLKEVAV